jgi:hypothetical protein
MLLHPLVQTLSIRFHPEQLLPEVLAMILHPGMNQFVQNDIIPEFVGQKCQLHVQADVVPAGAAPPSGFLVTDGYTVISVAMFPGYCRKPFREYLPGLIPINLDTATRIPLKGLIVMLMRFALALRCKRTGPTSGINIITESARKAFIANTVY